MQTTTYMIDVPSSHPISCHPWLEDGDAHWPHGDYYPHPIPIFDQQIAYDPSVALDVWQYQHGSVSYDAYGYFEKNEHLLDGSSASDYGAPVLPALAIASDGAYDLPPHSAPHDCHWDQQMSCLPAAYFLPTEHALQYSPGLLPASAGADSDYPSLDVHNYAGLSAHRENHAWPSSASHPAYHPALNAPIFSTDWDHDPRHQVPAIPDAASTSGTSSCSSNSDSHAHGQGQGQSQDEPHRCPLTVACLFCRKHKIACGSPPPGTKDRTCDQCVRRNLRCIYPEGSRREMYSKLLCAQDTLALQPMPIIVS